MRFAFLLLLVISATGFAETQNVPSGIIGGEATTTDPAVVFVSTPDGVCTGTLIASQTVLTAAHCLKFAAQDNRHFEGVVGFGNQVGQLTTIDSIRLLPQRYYTTGLFDGRDIALIRLKDPAPPNITPIPVNRRELTAADVGQMARAIGFGHTNGAEQTGAGIKRTVTMPIVEIDDEFVILGTDEKNTCQGDSGGPILMMIDGVEKVVGVTAFGLQGCVGAGNKTRVDSYLDFIDEVVSAWNGPCKQDGNCQTQGCGAFPDPDCDICGYDYFCGQNCVRPDLDCPLVGEPGDDCDTEFDCESRLCREDDGYCTIACESAKDCNEATPVCGSDGTCRFKSKGGCCESSGGLDPLVGLLLIFAGLYWRRNRKLSLIRCLYFSGTR